MRHFAEVFDTGSVSDVVLQLGMSQSSVSYALERLREDMNDQLFV
ncbi:MAG: LysR family transcriptional regulator [Rhodobacteraceae bacterium]|nr:LysR family transcriptional regulator [Paracoccaceae bacterium]